MFKIQLLDKISQAGLSEFPDCRYHFAKEIADPDVILVRSSNLKNFQFPEAIKAVGRAGIGTDNIPVDLLTRAGIPVFYTPGANANAVKELVCAALFLACRPLHASLNFVNELNVESSQFSKSVEQQKSQFLGNELSGKTLSVIGLGYIGSLVAKTALALGMKVIGFDPVLASGGVGHNLPREMLLATELNEALKAADYITLHVPSNKATEHLINHSRLALMKPGAVLLNFSRENIVDNQAILAALANGKMRLYVTDFPTYEIKGHPGVICFPHLGASTQEAEENCARAIACTIKNFLEFGSIKNAINFPAAELNYLGGRRLTVTNVNVPGVVKQISDILAKNKLNILAMLNQSYNEIAYNIMDVSDGVESKVLQEITGISGVLSIRLLPAISK